MQSNFYIQKGSDAAKDIFSEYGVVVLKTEGLTDIPNSKEDYSRDWADGQGLDVYVPDKVYYKDKNVVITFGFKSGVGRSQFDAFLKYIINPQADQFTSEPRNGVFQFWSDYRKTGVRLRYSTMKYNTERLRPWEDYIEAEITFRCYNGLSFGYSLTNSGYDSATFTIAEGETIDVFYSDGTRDLNKTETFTKSGFMFCVINPSSADAVIITN